jgi:hypothetical protein
VAHKSIHARRRRGHLTGVSNVRSGHRLGDDGDELVFGRVRGWLLMKATIASAVCCVKGGEGDAASIPADAS